MYGILPVETVIRSGVDSDLSTQHLNSHLLCILMKRHSTHDLEQVRCVKVHPALKENAMNTNTLLLIVIVLLLLGGGYYGRGRWF